MALLLSLPLAADPADIDAAARGVVRVVVIGSDGQEIYPVSHGTGFAVTPTRVVTNAHVLGEALEDDALRVGVVPADGEAAVYARVVAVSERNDLALLQITGSLRLPPLPIASSAAAGSGEVVAVGYPQNVDQAQGLELQDILRSQPPVKSRGYLSGSRPARQYDTILHTAPIARGNSGGPLLDTCGRVVGVNSFGTDGGAGAEFFFAVSARELLPFLRSNGVQAQVTNLPCRSLAEIEAEERDRAQALADAAEARSATAAEALRTRRERAQLEAQLAVLQERENHMAAAFLLTLLACGAATAAWQLGRGEHGQRNRLVGTGLAGAALLGACAAWLTRPGLEAIDERVNSMLEGSGNPLPDAGSEAARAAAKGQFVCRLEVDRSRITGTTGGDVAFGWRPDGCVNGRTQYASAGDGIWQRVLVPDDAELVSVQSFRPDSRTLVTERYLLDRTALRDLRTLRGGIEAPACGTQGGDEALARAQQALLDKLPARPNERLVYRCNPS
ncbi:serine protease [Porphyrobacter sp. GA68]|uniref:S1 family peptidase n=1 Tax=Porphyrobacter sp. GA68 TaxID=2883480 RepID=UPI001D183C5F|nr:serine protease [Porphyrobacter sp. GA68]